jgi:hypothetical protein
MPCLLDSSEHLEAPSIPQPAPNLHYLHHHCPVFEVLGCYVKVLQLQQQGCQDRITNCSSHLTRES